MDKTTCFFLKSPELLHIFGLGAAPKFQPLLGVDAIQDGYSLQVVPESQL
jgi:hypothetical protein